MTTIHLERDQVPPQLRLGYSGRKFKAVVCTEHTWYGFDTQWSGGSRTQYGFFSLDDLRFTPLSSSFGSGLERFVVEPGMVLRAHTMFQGKDLGVTFYVHPSNADTLQLPAPVDLDPTERTVLGIIRANKPAYRRSEAAHQGVTAEQYEHALANLKSAGFLNAAGALTTKGKNALSK